MDWFVKFWQLLSSPIKEVIVWVLDKHLKETLVILGAVASFIKLFGKKIYNAIKNYRSARDLKKKLPDYTPQQIERGIRYYIWPECQSVDPAQNDEARQVVAVRSDLCQTMDKMLKQDTIHKHFILLADTGMGKTSFLMNYFARHLRRWKQPYQMTLIPLNVPGLEKRLKKIKSPENTVLLMDAFDEDTEAIKNHALRLAKIMEWTRDFLRVVITCRTQFFPHDEEIPLETGIIKSGPRPPGEGPQFTFYKIYLSPFSDEQVQTYINRRFSFWNKKRRRQASAIVAKIPNLAVRPMLLAYVDDLIASSKSFQNSYQIYTEMVDAWLEREKRHVEDKDSLLKFSNKLAIELFVNREKWGGERIPYREIEPIANKFNIQLAIWQLTGRSLLNRDAEGNYKFAHRSILEFLFAQRILDNDDEIFQIPMKHWTGQVRSFLIEGLDRKPWRLPVAQRCAILSIAFEGGTFQLGETGKSVN
ncbi:hypothetical protein L0Z72_06870, partial [candidate division KSB1 bacterium]|nr:hypothetical protein [candidate division KSB1 bacterium]